MTTRNATHTGAFRRILYPDDQDMRVSDAERNEVADLLARHYGDGRLTQEEFNERVDRAMNAKTRYDLSGLFDDLPVLDGVQGAGVQGAGGQVPAARGRRPPRRCGSRPLLVLALITALLIVAGHGLWWFFMPHWLTVLLLIAVGVYVLRAVERGARHRDRND